jgi:hypothetical protein
MGTLEAAEAKLAGALVASPAMLVRRDAKGEGRLLFSLAELPRDVDFVLSADGEMGGGGIAVRRRLLSVRDTDSSNKPAPRLENPSDKDGGPEHRASNDEVNADDESEAEADADRVSCDVVVLSVLPDGEKSGNTGEGEDLEVNGEDAPVTSSSLAAGQRPPSVCVFVLDDPESVAERQQARARFDDVQVRTLRARF